MQGFIEHHNTNNLAKIVMDDLSVVQSIVIKNNFQEIKGR